MSMKSALFKHPKVDEISLDQHRFQSADRFAALYSPKFYMFIKTVLYFAVMKIRVLSCLFPLSKFQSHLVCQVLGKLDEKLIGAQVTFILISI